MKQFITRLCKLRHLLRTRRFRLALWSGVGAGMQHMAMLRELSPGMIIDVGANRGQFLLAALEACPMALVHAVEPQPGALAKLSSWLHRCPPEDQRRVTLHAVALAAQEGQGTLHVSARDDNSSLLEPTAEQLRLFPDTGMRGQMQVPLKRLDRLLTATAVPPDSLLKIDVQGAEASVLDGATAVLPFIRWVYVESSTLELYKGQALADAVAARLHNAGFALMSTHNPVLDHDGTLVQADHLFGRCETKTLV